MKRFKDNMMVHLNGLYSSLDFVQKYVESKKRLDYNCINFSSLQAGYVH